LTRLNIFNIGWVLFAKKCNFDYLSANKVGILFIFYYIYTEVAETDNIYILRFYGNEVNPESFTIKELGNLFVAFEDAIQAIADSSSSEPKGIDISVIAIANKSNSISITAKDELSKLAVNQYGEFVNGNKYTNLPEEAYSFHKKLVTTIKEKHCNVSLSSNSAALFDVKNEDDFIKQESVIIKIKTVLYGHLIGLSTSSSESEKARARIELFTGEKLNFEISQADRQVLLPYLWNVVGVNGTATYNTLTKNYIKLKYEHLISYRKGDIIDGLERIKKISSGFWDKLGSDDDITNYLKH
jgi:hypothetical protein